MYKKQNITVCIPAHNEEKFIGGVLKSIPEFVDHIIVVDDCSRDKTSAEALAVKDKRVEVLRNETNLGAGGSALRAFLHAMKQKSDVLVKVDGDGQMPLERLPALLDAIIDDGYDMAKVTAFSAENLASMPRHGPHIPIKPAGENKRKISSVYSAWLAQPANMARNNQFCGRDDLFRILTALTISFDEGQHLLCQLVATASYLPDRNQIEQLCRLSIAHITIAMVVLLSVSFLQFSCVNFKLYPNMIALC